FTTAYGAWMASQQIPYWPVYPSLAPSAWFNFQVDLARALFTILPGAVLWGASFPLAVGAAALRAGETDTDARATVGRVYAANTLGAIGGSLLTGLVLVTLMGTHGAQRVLIIVSAISAVAALFLRERSARKAPPGEGALGLGAMLLFAVLLLGAAWAAASVRHV